MARKIALGVLLLVAGVKCGGTETDNPDAPLVSFHASECKKAPALVGTSGTDGSGGSSGSSDAGVPTARASQALSYDAGYDGLQCIAWQRLGAGMFGFDLGNFHEGCGIEWKGNASVGRDGIVALDAIDAGCTKARCGWCIYDWTFEVRGVPEGKDARLRVRVADSDGASCEGSTDPYDVTVPTKDDPQGILCRPAFRSAVSWQVMERGTSGQLHTPCGPTEPAPCAAPLSCGPLGSADDLRCLQPCATDADCPLPGVLHCQEGTCRLARTW
jgi:hypothetical protein